ncbi:unnamed protein product [Caenorhabditis nigoni]
MTRNLESNLSGRRTNVKKCYILHITAHGLEVVEADSSASSGCDLRERAVRIVALPFAVVALEARHSRMSPKGSFGSKMEKS